MDLNTKLNGFSNDVKESAKKEYNQIEKEVQNEIELSIEQELKEYEEKKNSAYEKNIQKAEKEYNKNIFNYEREMKKELIEEEESLKENLKDEVKKIIIEYTKSEKYKSFLFKNIEDGLSKIESIDTTNIGLVEQDMKIDKSEILNKYNVKFFEIPSKYIGGCLLENKESGIYIDNTLLNSINEKIDNLDII